MKRIVLVLALMTLLLLPAAVAGATSVGEALPAGVTEVETWYKNEAGAWVSQGIGSATALARCWSSNPTYGACNKQNWVIDVTHHASVAQWIDWTISGTRWDWRIRKPGTYAADCITFTLKSNNDVVINYEGFADLLYQDTGGIDTDIETYYSFGGDLATADANGWVRAADLNSDDDLVPDSAGLHAGLQWKLWNKIVVVNCNSSSEYEDQATITLSLQNMKFWVDPDYGYYKSNQETITPGP